MPLTPPANTIDQKYAAALNALNHARTIPAIALLPDVLKADYTASRFTYTAKMQSEVATISLFSPGDGAALNAFYSDPGAAKFLSDKGLGAIKGGLSNGLQNAISGVGNATGQAGTGIGLGAGKAAKALTPPGIDIPGFLSALTNPNTWLRVAEVALGIVLIVVGLVKINPAVGKNIKTAGKVAALL